MTGHTQLSDLPPLLTVTEASEVLRASTKKIRVMLRDGELAGIKVGGVWRIPTHRLIAMLEGDSA